MSTSAPARAGIGADRPVPAAAGAAHPPAWRRLVARPPLVPSLLLWAGAVAVAWSAVIHLHLWSTGYRDIHVIGPLFLLQGVGGLAVAAAVAVTRHPLVAAGAALFALGTAAGLVLSVEVGLFGFRDSFAAPDATLALAVELAAALLLATGAVLARRAGRPARNVPEDAQRRRPPPGDGGAVTYRVVAR